jgi:hypothetical protein
MKLSRNIKRIKKILSIKIKEPGAERKGGKAAGAGR